MAIYTIRYTAEDYQGRIDSSFYTEDTLKDAEQTFKNVCSSLRSDFYACCYCKILVTLMEGDERIDEYALSDGDE